jgi:Ca2+:H+ antiporter
VKLSRADQRLLGLSLAVTVLAGVLRYAGAGEVLPFVGAAVALAVLAMLVGRSVEALGDRLGPGLTGVVQSGLGNLPELFVSIFALRAGLVGVVQAAIVGSVLANVLLVLGLAFVFGGVKHGPQHFGADQGRMVSLLLVLAVAALMVPGLTAAMHTPAAGHETALSIIVSVILLVIFALSLPAATQHQPGAPAVAEHHVVGPNDWPMAFAIGMLATSGVAAALVSDWFVHALEPAIGALHISETFAGLVVVAIAGNAIENVVGIQLALKDQADYAVSVILQSPLQVVLVLAPVLVLLSHVIGGAVLTLVFPPLLLAILALVTLLTVVIVFDGESTWLEGAILIGLYIAVASAFWWG